jgi:acetylornithine deacetylase/succinyl-diaminopimelate desuccinylase-like protein
MIPSIPEKTISAAIIACATLVVPSSIHAAETDPSEIRGEIAKRHGEAVKRLQDWIAAPATAAENRGYPDGARRMAQLAREAGFQQATVIETDGRPGVFATPDAGATKTVGLYFMYDVKQFDPAEWTSPPLNLASGHFGLGHGSGAHAPDECYVIESTNPTIQGFDGAVMSFVEYLYELGK